MKALYKARRDNWKPLPQNNSTVPMPKVFPPKNEIEEEPHVYVYGKHLGSLRSYDGKIFVAPNELAPISDAVEIKTINDIKKLITKKLLKDKTYGTLKV